MKINLGPIEPFLQIALVFLGAFLAAAVISIVVWTARDIRSRSRDIFVQLLSMLLVLVFNLPGLLLYFILRPRETLADSYERLLEEETLLQELEGRQACPYCHLRVEDDFLFCPGCHAQLRKTCMNCGRLMHLRWDLCPYCGHKEPGASVQAQAVVPPAAAEVMRPRIARDALASEVRMELAPAALSDETDIVADEETVAAPGLQGLPAEVVEMPAIQAAPADPGDQSSALPDEETAPAYQVQSSPEEYDGSTPLENPESPPSEDIVEGTTPAPGDRESA